MTNNTSPEPVTPEAWLDVRGISAYLAMGRSAVYHAIAEKGLPVHRTPTNRLIAKPSELDAWVRGQA